jgi:chitodextrinase
MSSRLLSLLSMLLVVLSVPQPLTRTVSAASDPCVTLVNPIVCENFKPGNAQSEWDLPNGVGSATIEGFAADISVNAGERIAFKVNTNASAYRIDIYRLGYYGGLGARKIATVRPTAPLPQMQPPCAFDTETRLTDCGNWLESASWLVPVGAVSGVYIGKLVREDGSAGVNHILFVVRKDFSQSDVLFQTSDATWQAYNRYGGYSLYYPSSSSRAYKVSYSRPFITRECCNETFFFSAEYPMLRWLEANGYDVTYFTGVDTARRGGLLRQHRVFLSVGHDEYVSGEQRANIEAAGIHLAFFSGNEMYWKTRWEPGLDGNPYGTLVTYKETYASAKIDPSPIWTGTWRDPRFSPPSDGGRPENALTGTLYTVNCCQSEADQNFSIQVPEKFGKFRLWRNTSVAALAPGTTALFPPGTLGYEWDEDIDNGARPAGLAQLSSATYNVGQRLIDYGNTSSPGPATHHLTLYRQRNGALVFGAGTIRWAWGLDATHDYPNPPADIRMQQATVNLFADMGVQPASIRPGLVPAMTSGDAASPASTIDPPSSAFRLPQPVTITGSAIDFGGGLVAGIEVSVDGGATWHPLSGWTPGQSRWTHTWTPAHAGTVTIKARAVDDSANLEVPGAGITITVASRPCPCSIWSASTVPAVPSSGDSSANELGLKFRTDTDGYITAVRFYKGVANTGQHVGHLWTSSGTLLGTATFSNETASGWQQANFSSPIPVSAGQTYVVSYFAPSGGYSQDAGYFASAGFDGSPLFALAANVDGANGVYHYGGSGYPNLAGYASSNYWVDVAFNTAAPPPPPAAPTGVSATAISSTQIDVAWQASTGATGYRVERSVDGGMTWTKAATTVDATTFSNTGLVPSTRYSYRIIATSADGASAPSATATATTRADTTVPSRPMSVTATGGSRSIVVSWIQSSDTGGSGLAGYEVWRSPTGAAGTFSRIATTTGTSYTNGGLKKHARYWYSVVAYDGAGNRSAPSVVVDARAN